MKKTLPQLIVFAAILVFCLPGVSYAKRDPNYLGMSLGMADVDVSGYTSSGYYSVFLGREFTYAACELGLLNFGNFEREEDKETYLTVSGWYFDLAAPIAFDEVVGIKPSIGFYRWGTDAYRYDKKWGDDSGNSLHAGLDLTFRFFGGRFDLGARYLDDVSGTSILQGQLSGQFFF